MSLILKAQLSLGSADALSDFSDELTSIKISAAVDEVEVPPTGTTPAHARGGAADFSVTIGYLANDIAGSLFSLLWDSLVTDGVLFFAGTMRDEEISATNPQWSGSFIVTEASLGAAAEGVSMGSATFPMLAAPAQETTPPESE